MRPRSDLPVLAMIRRRTKQLAAGEGGQDAGQDALKTRLALEGVHIGLDVKAGHGMPLLDQVGRA